MKTTPGQSYCVNVLTAPVEVQAIYADGTTETLKTLDSAGQYTFIAMSAETRFSGGEIGKQVLPVPFNSAPAGNGNGGGAQPASPAVTELLPETPAVLEDGRVYHIAGAPDGGFNMTTLEVAPNATARIWVDAATGNVVFPPAWVWSDTSEFQLPAGTAGGVGDFVDGDTYLVTVCRYSHGGKDFILAHRALTIKTATA